jgi:broad-specificity NMP kinase
MHSKIILASIVIVTAAIAAFAMTIHINTTNASREETASKVVQAGGGNTTIS